MPSSVAPGMFILHSNAIPDLTAGSYTVHAEQSFTAPESTTTALDSHIEVTAPRFGLPSDQILSTFPPNKSEGPFTSRLPQIVLKRRTLPWERIADPAAARGTPWLALVLLADGECDFLSGRPIADCITPGVVLTGRNDVTVGDAIVVTQTVINQVFPTQDELPLLTHVREVDLSDTELAMGDDDGWLAVVLCNRVPQDRVRYRACLISLEGQYQRLAPSSTPAPQSAQAFVSPYVYPTAAIAHGARIQKAGTGRSMTVADAWSTHATTERVLRKTDAKRVQYVPSAAHVGEMQQPGTLDSAAPGETRFTFPVLANWQFACKGTDDFQTLMQKLDVGLLDTVVVPAPKKAGDKPAPPRTREEPQVVDTGHVVLSHTTRAGEDESVWYRGPLLPHPGGRDVPDDKGQLPLLHASDQARRIGPDGRENLSLAAAFEIGRLLALAEPKVVAAFLNWRKEGFENARRMELAANDPQLKRVDVKVMLAGYAARMGNRLLADLGQNEGSRLGNPRPLVDAGAPIPGIDGSDIVQLIATGFGLSADTVRGMIAPGVSRNGGLTTPVAPQTSDFGALSANTAQEFGHLRTAANTTVAGLATGALAGGTGGALGAPADALDALLQGRVSG